MWRDCIRDALLAAPGDSAALAKALDAALQSGPEIQAMVQSGLERAGTFSMASLAARYVELYERAQHWGTPQGRSRRLRSPS